MVGLVGFPSAVYVVTMPLPKFAMYILPLASTAIPRGPLMFAMVGVVCWPFALYVVTLDVKALLT